MLNFPPERSISCSFPNDSFTYLNENLLPKNLAENFIENNKEKVKEIATKEYAGFLFQSPNYYGSVESINKCNERVALYGSTTVSETLGDGNTENVSIILALYSSLIFPIRRVPLY